jgi:hypothetical protein
MTNPTSHKGVDAHGSACNRAMHVATTHLGRSHRRCVPKDTLRRDGSCKITAGKPEKKEAAQ